MDMMIIPPMKNKFGTAAMSVRKNVPVNQINKDACCNPVRLQ